MKRVTLCETAYIDLTEEQYNNCKTIHLISETTGELREEAKEIYLEKEMILIVPIVAFENVND